MPAKNPSVLNLVVDQRFLQSPDGSVWSHTPPTYDFLQLALTVFDKVRVIGRTAPVSAAPPNVRLVNGPGVELIAVPSYVGPFQYLRRHSSISEVLSGITQLDGAFLLRIPSQTGFLLASRLERIQRPYAVEILTDPHDFFAPGVSPHGLAYLFRPYFCRRSRELCSRARVANYVTGSSTREANPPSAAIWSGSISDVDLPSEAFLPLRSRPAGSTLEIISVGFLDLLYKGQDLLIRSLAKCRQQGLDFNLTFAGDGESRTRLLELAAATGIGDRVRITGALGGAEQVRSWLARSDLFVLPSRAEGIPRALLEAMAAGLPAICSNVGAMPDLLPARWIVPANSADLLTLKLMEFASAPELWSEMSARNQAAARGFERSVLQPQRKQFYEAVRDYASVHPFEQELSNAA
jgi:glycosyltransferase involved in cell wall biosynthesis